MSVRAVVRDEEADNHDPKSQLKRMGSSSYVTSLSTSYRSGDGGEEEGDKRA
jgi:hypothetical protein